MKNSNKTAFDRLEQFLQKGEFPPPPEYYTPGTPLVLYHFTAGNIPEEPGAALLVFEEDAIHLYGVMCDRENFSMADHDNQELWLLGDAFELFFRCSGREDYLEFQTAPNGIRLELHIQDYRTFRNVPFKDRICSCGLEVNNRYDAEKQLWYSEMRIPFSGMGLTRENIKGSSFTVIRQNHFRDKEREITASCVFPETAHYPQLWHKII